ncbi:hypothetical protein A2526_03480 [candidate division WOR-1 bacterium RIFOXYD2_FULL_36_8]|uniref:Uncharacterized protein n=1 Tax=candidate division WOR-1 bacterium RIFOXYB2_FULL_36_35 TaxID=1802578 RepID=A0A1F4S272_UNCSA|nr:MAG: hypothetical protein A2230_04020 [candidate division WOR-1 bacterium RIFOXYA2_FULL_36_21]OGC14532.1 MAG: hypothetical protein A2290_00035 [candidate division WOR-1 bacterium RIFOXYB2_FULL_36_35]OGC16892.1 MAG: hypothetical protein A2282_08555 [candidate division WOR-1 bacterium RIFOXYA12_FULL_36_13]OGC39190.1 MAG: hypothetical protein A2526_03480 [candidate division WOR-1 bacterium RIFOXYD2_FULL_36_8]
MSNIHTVTQVAPQVLSSGCCIKVQDGKEEKIKRVFKKIDDISTLTLKSPCGNIIIDNMNEDITSQKFATSDMYLVISSGFSYDYDENFRMCLQKLAPFLEDASFYITDEHGNVHFFEMKKNMLKYKQFIITHNRDTLTTYESFIEYYQQTFPKNKTIIFQLLKSYLFSLTGDICNEDEYKHSYEKMINAALAIQPNDWEILHHHGVVLIDIKRYKQAIAVIKKAIRSKHIEKPVDDYDCLLIYTDLAHAYVMDKQYTKAIACADKGSKIVPNRGDYRLQEKKAYALLALKQFKAVIETCDEILKRSRKKPDISYAYFNKACALIMLKQYNQAAACLTAAFTMDTYLPKIASNDPENLMLYKKLMRHPNTKSIMGSTYEFINIKPQNIRMV